MKDYVFIHYGEPMASQSLGAVRREQNIWRDGKRGQGALVRP